MRYAIGAMQPIDPAYTRNTFEQGDRVKHHLKSELKPSCDFEYQGSTTTDTHIKAKSDIDLLVIRTDWFWVDPSQPNSSPYKGDPIADMREMRLDTIGVLTSAFTSVDVDASKPKAITLQGGSLRRVVDVVPASWFDTNDYVRTQDRALRGVKVFDAHAAEFLTNFPFLHKRRIEERDQVTRGGLRRATRLMKSLMYDSDGRVEMSSYNITGIAFNIPAENLTVQPARELAILEACWEFCRQLEADAGLRTTIRVPDGHRLVCGSGPGATIQQIGALAKELNDLRKDVLTENARSFEKLAEARVELPAAVRSW